MSRTKARRAERNVFFSASRQAHQMRLNGIVEMSDREAESGTDEPTHSRKRDSATAHTATHNPLASIWQRDKAMN